MNRRMNEDGMRELCAAVVINVCEEYLKACRPKHLAHLRKWFFSDDFAFYSDMDPETVVNRLDAMRKANMTHLPYLYVGECSHQHEDPGLRDHVGLLSLSQKRPFL